MHRIRRIALFVLHFGKLPEQIDPEEINEYLVAWPRILNLPPAAVLSTWFTDFAITIACWVKGIIVGNA